MNILVIVHHPYATLMLSGVCCLFTFYELCTQVMRLL